MDSENAMGGTLYTGYEIPLIMEGVLAFCRGIGLLNTGARGISRVAHRDSNKVPLIYLN